MNKLLLLILFILIFFFAFRAVDSVRQSFEGGDGKNIGLNEIGGIMKDVKGLKDQKEEDVKEFDKIEE